VADFGLALPADSTLNNNNVNNAMTTSMSKGNSNNINSSTSATNNNNNTNASAPLNNKFPIKWTAPEAIRDSVCGWGLF